MQSKFSKLSRIFMRSADGRTFYRDDADKETKDRVRSIQSDDDAPFEISYEIYEHACDILAEGYDEDELYERASVYTSARLEYISTWNHSEVSEIMKEYECDDIGTAAAIWYDQKVNEACRKLAQEFADEAEEE